MAKIVLDSEPTCTKECPFGGFRKCYLSKESCKAIRKTTNERGKKTDTIAFDTDKGVWYLLIDFERCPYCTTFEKEYIKVLREGEI